METNSRQLVEAGGNARFPIAEIGPSYGRFRSQGGAPSAPSKVHRPWSALLRDTWARTLNVLVAGAGLLVCLPLMVAIALAIRLSGPGPIIYSQDRVGLDRRRRGSEPPGVVGRRKSDGGGRVFRIYKFRTMRVESDQAAEVWAEENDPRVTRVGRILRKYRLDELPQLWNVLHGDMNIVGPRPEQPSIFAELRGVVAGYDERQRVLPGITGWAQINQPYDRCLDDVRNKVRLDLEYIDQRSPAQDLKIMLKTVPVVVLKRGAH